MAYLAAAYDKAVSEERLAVYWDQFGSLADEPFRAACREIVGREERFPTPSVLRTAYLDQLRRERMRPIPRLEDSAARGDPERVRSEIRKLWNALR